MNIAKEQLSQMLTVEGCPLSDKYDPEWVLGNEMGPNVLWLTEALCREMDLKPGMRVLDMGCGKAMSSIFLAKEFGDDVPKHLTKKQPNGDRFWDPAECFSIRTVEWWRKHWGQTELVDIEVADTLPDGWRQWLQFEEAKVAAGTNRNTDEVAVLQADKGEYLGFVRVVARRRETG